MSLRNCIFCQPEKLTILYKDAQLALFKDIRPSAPHHYLIIPNEHAENVKYLTKANIPLIEKMRTFALDYARDNIAEFKAEKSRFGFHWAPFNSISHLHLHMIFPVDDMSFIARNLVFRPNSWWFCEVDPTIEYLKNRI